MSDLKIIRDQEESQIRQHERLLLLLQIIQSLDLPEEHHRLATTFAELVSQSDILKAVRYLESVIRIDERGKTVHEYNSLVDRHNELLDHSRKTLEYVKKLELSLKEHLDDPSFVCRACNNQVFISEMSFCPMCSAYFCPMCDSDGHFCFQAEER